MLSTRGQFHKLFVPYCCPSPTFAPVKSFSKVGRRARIGRKKVYNIYPCEKKLTTTVTFVLLWKFVQPTKVLRYSQPQMFEYLNAEKVEITLGLSHFSKKENKYFVPSCFQKKLQKTMLVSCRFCPEMTRHNQKRPETNQSGFEGGGREIFALCAVASI